MSHLFHTFGIQRVRRFATTAVYAGALCGLAACAGGASRSDPAAWAEVARPGASPNTERLFAGLDANGDGLIHWREVGGTDARVESHFWLSDRNHDGRVDRKEFEELVADITKTRHRPGS